MVSIELVIEALQISGGEASSADLTEILGCTQPEVSRKLSMLRKQGIVHRYPTEGSRGYVSIFVLAEEVL